MSSIIADVKEQQFVQKRMDAVLHGAQLLCSRGAEKSPFIKYGLETLDKNTSWLSRPLFSKLSRLGQPVLQSLDSALAKAYTTASHVVHPSASDSASAVSSDSSDAPVASEEVDVKAESVVMAPSWFEAVDAILRQRLLPSQPSLPVQFQTFYTNAVTAFASLEQKTYGKFAEALQSRLQVWDETLVLPAKQFYARAADRLQTLAADGKRLTHEDLYRGVQSTVHQVWDQSFVAVSARSFYNAAVKQYVDAKDQSPALFVAAMRSQLGVAWNDKLTKPLLELYDNVKVVAERDIARVMTVVLPASAVVTSSASHLSAQCASVVNGMNGFVRQCWVSVLKASESSVNYLLPVEQGALHDQSASPASAETPASPASSAETTFTSLRADVSSRLRLKAQQNWNKLRQLSATQGKDILHVDPIAYAEQVIDRAASYSQSTYACTSHKLAGSLATARTSLAAVKETLQQRSAALHQHISDRSSVLQLRLKDVVARATDLSSFAGDVISQRVIVQAPLDLYVLFAKSVGLKEKDQEFESFVAHLHKLGQSVRELVWHMDSSPSVSSPAPCEDTQQEVAAGSSESAAAL